MDGLGLAILVAAGLSLLLLHAVRQGRFASPAARIAGFAVIAILALLAWLGPILLAGR